jgi:CDP-diacylglycerol--glycerol-3-phosphate 3-phosphatidyltransferase
MMRRFIRQIPNCLSFARMGLAPAAFAFRDYAIPFVVLYLLCGLTDVLDGFLARRLHAESEAGARLDSAADVVFYVTLVALLAAKALAAVVAWLPAILAIAAVRVATLAVSRVRFGRAGSVHTYGNKLAGFCVYLLPLFISGVVIPLETSAGSSVGIIAIACVVGVAFLSAVEELIIVSKTSEFDPDRKSLFPFGRERANLVAR